MLQIGEACPMTASFRSSHPENQLLAMGRATRHRLWDVIAYQAVKAGALGVIAGAALAGLD